MTRTKLRTSLVERAARVADDRDELTSAELHKRFGPPWVVFCDKGKPYSIMPAGRAGDVAIVKGMPIREVAKLMHAANSSVAAKQDEAMDKIDFAYEMVQAALAHAARVAEKRACLVCAASGDKIPGHEMCWAYVEIAREIRKIGTVRDNRRGW